MAVPSDELLTAGHFAEMAGTTKAQLRFYRQAGIFQPAWRDESNGYFYYRVWQVHHLYTLLLLEHFGYSIKELAEIFQKDILSYREMVIDRQDYMENWISQLQHAVSFVEYDIRRIERLAPYTFDRVYLQEAPVLDVATTLLPGDADRFDESAREGLLRHIETYGNSGDYRAYPLSLILSRRCLYDGGYHLSGYFSQKRTTARGGKTRPVLCYRTSGCMADLNRVFHSFSAYLQEHQLEPAGDIYLQVWPENTKSIADDRYESYAYLPVRPAARPIPRVPLPQTMLPNHGTMLMSSGEFARLCGITKETLRFYHKHRLIIPVKKDEKGYYYYACQQISTFHALKALQQAGRSLKEIRDYFADETCSYTELCKRNLSRLKRQLELAEYYLECLDVDYHYTSQLSRQPRNTPFVCVTALPASRVTAIDPPCPMTARALAPYLQKHAANFSNTEEKLEYPLSIYVRPEDLEQDEQKVCAISSLPHVNYAGEVSTPPQRLLCYLTRGGYEQMFETMALLQGHLKSRGFRATGNFCCSMLVDKFCRLPEGKMLMFVYVPIEAES